MITDHATMLLGKRVAPYRSDAPFAFERDVPRVALDWESHVDGLGMADLLAELVRQPGVDAAEGLVFGPWDFLGATSSSVIVDALVGAKANLPKLRAVHLGDIVHAEQELPFISHGDVWPLLAAFPNLEELHVRGSSGLAFGEGPRRHAKLRRLVVESAGLRGEFVRALFAVDLPALEELELWIGSEDQGASVTLDLLEPLLLGDLFPSLKKLALRNAESADLLAGAIAEAPVLSRLTHLDLSLGTLSDEGAEPLLASERIRQMQELDLQKSYLSPEMVKRFHAFSPVIANVRGSRFGKDDARRPSTVPPREKLELPLTRLRTAQGRRR